jgi:4-diphosphocytidyl-2-C-methyl-D-erythritol kinase
VSETRVHAPAKVTLSLRVVGVRDDGYHELEALTLSTTAPHDVLVVVDAPVTSITVTGAFADGVPTDETNLVARALTARGTTRAVTIDKAIPAGAGLGGGSSDAAAVLRLLGGTAADAAALGSDVPFCLHQLPAWMRGRGEVIEPIDGLTPLDLVIAAPHFGCDTPAVYRAWDALGGPRASREVAAPAGYPGPFVNDLEPAAEQLEPRLIDFRREFEQCTHRPALLCGSGSAFAAWFDDDLGCDDAYRLAQERFGDRVWRATTIVA